MDDEKLLPRGESASQTPAPSYFHLENKLNPSPNPAPVLPAEPAPAIQKPIAPPTLPIPEDLLKPSLPGVPSVQQQSWGVVISIAIIVLMIIIGAFYAWGQRIAQNQPPAAVTQ